MARCTAPVRGHRTASGRAECPACGGRGGYGGYSGYRLYSAPVLLLPFLLLIGEQRGRPKQWRRVPPQHKTTLVGNAYSPRSSAASSRLFTMASKNAVISVYLVSSWAA